MCAFVRSRVRGYRASVPTFAAVWLAAILIAGIQMKSVRMQAAAPAQQPAAPANPPTPQATLQRYCLTCHNQNLKERGTVPIAFDKLNSSNVGADAEVWEKIVRKVRTGLMPPAGRPRPDKPTHDAFVSWMESSLDGAAATHPNPGRTEPFHRLNRAEYKNVIRDLLDLDVNVDALLPSDDASYGFDNIAGVLHMSPTLMARYLAAAQKISSPAVGTAPPAPNVDLTASATISSRTSISRGCPSAHAAACRFLTPSRWTREHGQGPLARDILENIGVSPKTSS